MIESSERYKTCIIGASRRIMIKAVVDISDPDMVLPEPTATSTAPWTKPGEIHDKVMDNPARYATLEANRWLLDGSFNIFPDNYHVPESMGYTMDELSGEDGAFTAPQVLTQPIENVSILQAFSVYFSGDELDGVASDFTVEVVQGETAYFSKIITGNTESKLAFDGFTVYDPNFIRVTVTKWSLPSRRARFVEIIPGVYEEWTDKVLASFSATQQADFSCITLPYGTLTLSLNNVTKRFEPRKKNSLFQSIEARQGIEPYIGVRLPSGVVEYKKLGVFYQYGDGWKTSSNDMAIDWSLVDIVGLVADRTYLPPDTLPTTLNGWIASIVAQLGENFAKRYHVDPDYAGKAVTARGRADVTGKKCGDILRWACMATGTWPRADAETGYLTAEPLWNQGNKLLLASLARYPTMKANESVASLIFQLADGNNTQYVVSGNSTSSGKTITIQNPFIHTSAEALTAARLILSCYGGNVIETTGRGDPASEIGDVDTIWLDESNATTARRKMQTFSISGGVLQNCQSRMLQADGSYLYEAYELITESGKWKAPAGVTKLRLIIGSGGQGGGKGTAGSMGTEQSDYSIGNPGYEGQQGANGSGGKIWAGTVSINPEQEFEVHIGAGGLAADVEGKPGGLGEATTFGAYSSDSGEVYPIGYSDIATGSSFGRSGVAKPKPNTSDGGVGGEGGAAGMEVFVGTEPVYNDQGEQIGFRVIYATVSEPTEGKKGSDGASGFVMVSWDKEDAAV